jgi:hypothetical protein
MRRRPKRRGPDVYGLEWARISSMYCLVCGHRGGPAHHVKRVGNGGKDLGNVVPLCVEHHQECHGGEQTFEAKYDVDLKQIAKGLQ